MNRKQRRAAKITSSPRPAASPDAVRKMFDEALRHHHAGHLGKAERSYRKILAINPIHAESLHYLGVIAYDDGRYEAAAVLIGQAIGVKEDVPAFHHNLGLVFSKQGKLDEAAACFGRALAGKPDFADAHYSLGLVLGRQGHLDEALASYRRAIALKPDYTEAHNNLGTVLAKQHKFAEAIASYEHALAISPDYEEARHNLGLVLKQQEKLGGVAPRAKDTSLQAWCRKSRIKLRAVLGRLTINGRSDA